MSSHSRVLLVALVALLFASFVAPVEAQASKNNKRADDDLHDLIDLANLGLFVVAGGPGEVIPRLLVLGFFTLVAVLIARCFSCICGHDYDRYDCYERSDTGRAIGWGLTACNSYTLGNEAWSNRHRW